MPVIKCVRKIEYVRVRLRLTHQRCLELSNFDVCNGVIISQALLSLSRIESFVILANFVPASTWENVLVGVKRRPANEAPSGSE